MNLDELERLHRKAVGGDWRNLPSNMLNEIWDAFPALLALARDGERYRWIKDSGNTAEGSFPQRGITIASGGKIVFHVVYWCSQSELDAAVDAARKGEQ